MTSANRLSTSRMVKRIRLRKPSLLRRKRRQARRPGETWTQGGGAAGAAPCGATSGKRPISSAATALAEGSVKFDTGVDEHVTEVTHQLGEQADEREQVKG